MMQKMGILLLLCVSLCAQYDGFVTTKGREIVTVEGKPILLKGINLGNWLVPEGYMFHFQDASSPRLISQVFLELLGPEKSKKFWEKYRDIYTTKEDIHFLRECGFNSIRVPFNFRLFVCEEHPEHWIKTGFEMLDRVIAWCKEEKIWVILDMHCAPGGQTGDNIDDSVGYPHLFEDAESQELTIRLWREIANRYKDETIVLGYDLLNEPIAHFFDAEKLNPTLEPLFKKIVSAIREVDQNHIVFLGGAQWNSNFGVFGAPFDDKLVYTFHKYWTEPTVEVIQSYLDYAQKYNVPIWMGESGENTNEWITTFRKTLESNNVGWCFWPYKKMDSAVGVVSIPKTKEWEKIIEYANQPRPSLESVRKLKPSKEIIEKAFSDFLENCRLEKCKVNAGYLEALGLGRPLEK